MLRSVLAVGIYGDVEVQLMTSTSSLYSSVYFLQLNESTASAKYRRWLIKLFLLCNLVEGSFSREQATEPTNCKALVEDFLLPGQSTALL